MQALSMLKIRADVAPLGMQDVFWVSSVYLLYRA